ncbi:MAG: RHS repeat-associated core domain-containing protein [Candidatus Bathyarchaeota archaeon]
MDHLGNTRLKTDASGNVIYESNYEPYGPGYSKSGLEEFRYTGKQEDATGLYYFGARYYDPVTGRFITRDSVFGDLSDPQSLNRYSYCRNNPHKYVDPDGENPIIAGALLGGLVNFMWYIHETLQTGKEVTLRGAIGAFTNGAICGAAAVVIATTAPIAIISKVVYSSVVSGTANAMGGMVEDVVNEEEINIDEVASDFGFGALVGGALSPLPAKTFGYVTTVISSNTLCSNKDAVVKAINTSGDNLIEQIRESILITPKINNKPSKIYAERIDYWWY